ncbi:Cullin-3 [Scheffersomyces spartinae]|uniref:Cullin-3 n=1 Tax=Scheffersomyces spartinae TaxID=45513 RepID=A0A9P7V5I9_9ASCO|nr:Cullin-3 [Scheffersomyces spartinae]KAG7191550.1 Cullin-3 [Scheffersomyces spartinae]
MLPSGNKRTKIRPPRRSLLDNAISGVVKDHGAEFEKSWRLLLIAIKLIQEKNVSELSYEQLYRMAYTLVLKNYGTKLYDNVCQQIKQHLLQRRLHLVLSDMMDDEANFLKEISIEWNEHLQAMKFISDVLMYMNRVHVKEQKVPYIYDLGIVLFLENVIEYNDHEIGHRLIDTIILEINNSWKGQIITTKTYITKTISMMNELEYGKRTVAAATVTADDVDNEGSNYYQRYFEPRFLSVSSTFFSQFALECLALESGSHYVQATSQFINEQESMLNFFLSTTTHPKLMQLMCNVLVKDRIDYIISLPYENHGLSYWLDNVIRNITATTRSDPHYEELRLLYDLVGRFDPERKLLKLRLRDRIIEDGQKIEQIALEMAQNSIKSSSFSSSASKKSPSISFNSSSFATNWVNSVLDFKNQYFKIISRSFGRDHTFEESIISSMRTFVNKNGFNAPEILSIYIDHCLKQLTKGGSKTPVDELLGNALTFINLIRDKDAFEAYYANHFAKRFLNSKGGASRMVDGMDIEDLFISKVVDMLGLSTVAKLLKMNKETKLSWELTKEWKKLVEADKDKSLIEMELKICNTVDWPKSMTKDYRIFVGDEAEGQAPFIWPKQLRHTMKQFEEYWSLGKKNSSKKLYWSPKFGNMELRISYPSRTYDISLSTYAGIIMLLFAPQSDESCILPFEEKRSYTYTEIKGLTQINDADLRRQLQSIAVAPRLRLLTKTPMSKEVNDLDIFQLNEKFKSPTTKVKVLTVSSSSSSSGSTGKVTATTADDDSLEVNARIIEGRKVILDAAVVRIMKSRMSLNHNDLIGELLKQLASRFQPLPLMIKQCLAGLIEKDYIMRDPKERNVYRYIA